MTLHDTMYVLVGTLMLVGIGGLTNLRARRETAEGRPLSVLTRAFMMVAFGGLTASIAAAAWARALPLDLPAGVALGVGIAAMTLGIAVVVAVFTGIRKRTWDVDTDRLATDGMYALSRNPRAVGWCIFHIGLGLATRSGAVLALAGVFLLGYLPWILLEEIVLERHFGASYRAYKARTPRFVRLLPRVPAGADAEPGAAVQARAERPSRIGAGRSGPAFGGGVTSPDPQ